VPDHSTVVGVPGRIVRSLLDTDNLEHGHLPDPEGQLIEDLSRRVDVLEKLVRSLAGESAITRGR